MPCRPATFRNENSIKPKVVFAQCDQAGELLANASGKVSYQYALDGKQYEAAMANLTVVPDGAVT